MEMFDMDYLKDISEKYKFDSLVTRSGRELEKKAIFSPINDSLLAIVNPEFKFVRPFDFVTEIDSVLKESAIPVTNKDIFMDDKGSKINVSYRTSMQEDVIVGDEVDFGFDVSFNVSKDIKFEILSWRQVCENGLVSFSPIHSLKRDNIVGHDEIVQSISFCVNQFRESDMSRFRKMTDTVISKNDAMIEVGNYKLKEEEKAKLFMSLEEEFGASDSISEWRFFNVLMFVATHVLSEKAKRLRKMAKKSFDNYSVCYHGVPHRFVNN